jgi:hypothetical protein
MKKSNSILLAALAIALTTFSSCEAIKGLIGFGFWLGVIAVVVIIVIIFWVRGRTK